MPTTDATELLRSGLLEGLSMLLACAPQGARAPQGTRRSPAESAGGSLAAAVHAGASALGARVFECAPMPTGASAVQEQELDGEVERALAEAGHIEMLVVDGAGLYASAASTGDERAALGACLDVSWNVTRSLATRAFLPATPAGTSGGTQADTLRGARKPGGRIVYLAPAPGAGAHADAARAGLENLARTLSIEWARSQVTAVAIAPGDATEASEVAALTAYLASPAGAYFSGCLFDLRGGG
jgi:NAD(P)-dependent dehydrogenase (short-subunit alcohol dehydrogenase family)